MLDDRVPATGRSGSMEALAAAIDADDGSLPVQMAERARRLAAIVIHAERTAWPEDEQADTGRDVIIDLTAASIASTSDPSATPVAAS